MMTPGTQLKGGAPLQTVDQRAGKHMHVIFKTPLWRSALRSDTDDMLQPIPVQ
jgi:hypothetical protein